MVEAKFRARVSDNLTWRVLVFELREDGNVGFDVPLTASCVVTLTSSSSFYTRSSNTRRQVELHVLPAILDRLRTTTRRRFICLLRAGQFTHLQVRGEFFVSFRVLFFFSFLARFQWVIMPLLSGRVTADGVGVGACRRL